MSGRVPVVVLGGSGYVAGELLRLLASHPGFELAGALSDSKPGEPVAGAFPHLQSVYAQAHFKSRREIEAVLAEAPRSGILSAAPHGVAAALIEGLLDAAQAAGKHPRVVDISADFRYRSGDAYRAVYGHEHGAPRRLAEFTCAIPEHLQHLATPHVAHPGCFATAVLLASVPLLTLGLTAPTLYVSGITGSSGSGRKAVDGTHHPLRHADVYSYSPLAHRHVPEIIACARATSGVEADFSFVPSSGPFVRGIHVTVQGALRSSLDSARVLGALREFYARAPFVRVSAEPPRVKNVVASNYAHLSAAANGRTVAVMCVLDNLVKGAAGGALQWLNRMFDLPETQGLEAPAPGWT
ncbi:MAG TPA: N-acetyl-gamma-glutamyl-phosphate reductase [Steroidobacteraceae bacterium]|nr:N-acetyl-gamma-glutamyl-phosphate reductase [Steroidobacteraceae bacterium]